jgi:hypothetical protein
MSVPNVKNASTSDSIMPLLVCDGPKCTQKMYIPSITISDNVHKIEKKFHCIICFKNFQNDNNKKYTNT